MMYGTEVLFSNKEISAFETVYLSFFKNRPHQLGYYIMYEDAGRYQYSPLHKITNYCAEIVDSLDFHACVQLVGVSRRYQ